MKQVESVLYELSTSVYCE